jgi:Sec-independent protein secretion pathway component TatC
VLAAIVTPSTDPLQQTFLALPLIGLYEIAIVIASRIERRRERSGHAALLALIALLPRRQKRWSSVGVPVRSGL